MSVGRLQQWRTVFFLQANDARTKWVEVLDEDEICGTASAGLPPEILDYC